MNIGYNTPLHKSASRRDAKFGRKIEYPPFFPLESRRFATNKGKLHPAGMPVERTSLFLPSYTFLTECAYHCLGNVYDNHSNLYIIRTGIKKHEKDT